MNALWPKILKSAYRREPISSFLVIIGAVDALIGGVGERWSLLTFGLMMVVLAVALRWWQTQRKESELAEQPVTHFLPPASSRPALPILSTAKRQRPR
ncbi:MAG TPA: hypothetical protein DCP31_13750 [Cyanobacteria bacterium UBA8543]|nr:hypothetical protein [Cyanobacteria bacterium UBA8543]